ncbi:unnamed protein product [Schistosoma turkestanicum]|nr:unnamed protein product [Schistosoma turkestanicum]
MDEEGVVAAAATGIKISTASCFIPHEPVPEFRVDHPFIVSVIWNDTLPIFLGHITAPTNE